MGVQSGQGNRGLPRMFGSAPDGRHQPRTAGDRLAVPTLPALACIGPVAFEKQAFDQAFNMLGQLEFER